MDKTLLSLLAIALTLYAFVPYIRSIRRGVTKPHVFSWVIWGSTTFLVFLAQMAAKGGAGAWPIGVSGVVTLYVAWLAWQQKADTNITRTDRIFFSAAMLSLPLWFITSDPLWAVLVLTIVDLLGFAPSFRKAWHHPHEEQMQFFVLMILRNLLALAALTHYSLTTTLFPAAIVLACVLFVAMVQLRRSMAR